MLTITCQWPGATLFSNGLLYLDPAVLLEANGWDPGTLDEKGVGVALALVFEKVGIDPASRLFLTNPENN